MNDVLASDVLAPWGQAAAIILLLYLFLSIVVGLALAAILMFGFAWIREKSELLRRLRPQVVQLNRAAIAARRGEALPSEVADNKIVAAVVQIPKVANTISNGASSVEQKVEKGSDRVASAVIEFHARTAMVKGVAKAFFLPGLTRPRSVSRRAQPVEQQVLATQQRENVSEPALEERPLEREIIITQSSR